MADLIRLLRERLEPVFASRTHPLVGSATWSIGKIVGGASVNIVPETCTVEIDRRLLPGETGRDALAEIDAAIQTICQARPDIHVRRDEPFGDVSGLDTSGDAAVVHALQVACRSAGREARLVGVPYGTNASKFADVGIPCVVFGPGDVAQAHTANEFVVIDQVVAAAGLYDAAVRAF